MRRIQIFDQTPVISNKVPVIVNVPVFSLDGPAVATFTIASRSAGVADTMDNAKMARIKFLIFK